jgi:ribonuclease-3
VAGPADDLHELQLLLGYDFDDPTLLDNALVHRSWCAENPGAASNERLEFLGDSVLGLSVTSHIYEVFGDLPEGPLAKLRATVVSSPTLAALAETLYLGQHLRLGRGEAASGGRSKPSILADAMEAVIGAVFLDAGWARADEFVINLLGDRIDSAAEKPGRGDYKTRLQERHAQISGDAPRYDLTESGPDHAKMFQAKVIVAGVELGAGTGSSKKEAEQAAAEAAWRNAEHEATEQEPGR